MSNIIKNYIEDVKMFCDMIDMDELEKACEIILKKYKEGKQIFVAGNGGSAGTSNHFSCDFGKNAVKNDLKRPKIISLSSNIEVLTALGNDFCYAEVFSQQMKNLFNQGDLIILISASGNSPNVISAAEYAKSRGGTVVGLTGFNGGKLKELSDFCINVSSDSYEKIEDIHMIVTHIIVCWFKNLNIE